MSLPTDPPPDPAPVEEDGDGDSDAAEQTQSGDVGPFEPDDPEAVR